MSCLSPEKRNNQFKYDTNLLHAILSSKLQTNCSMKIAGEKFIQLNGVRLFLNIMLCRVLLVRDRIYMRVYCDTYDTQNTRARRLHKSMLSWTHKHTRKPRKTHTHTNMRSSSIDTERRANTTYFSEDLNFVFYICCEYRGRVVRISLSVCEFHIARKIQCDCADETIDKLRASERLSQFMGSKQRFFWGLCHYGIASCGWSFFLHDTDLNGVKQVSRGRFHFDLDYVRLCVWGNDASSKCLNNAFL